MRFEAELEDHLTRRDAERTLRAVTAWGRYTELFAYDDRTHTFSEIPRQNERGGVIRHQNLTHLLRVIATKAKASRTSSQ